MTVRQLIAELESMPKNLPVCFSAHDNSSWEIADYPRCIVLYDKSKNEFKCPDYIQGEQRTWYNSMPKKAVLLRS